MFPGRKLILLYLMLLLSSELMSQSLKGKVIYVSPSQEVMVKFPSVITNYNFVNKEAANLFETRITNNKNFSINSTVPNFKRTNLIITEGGNSHLFIIEFKESLDATTESLYDYGRKRDLQAEVNNLARIAANTPPVITAPASPQTATNPVSGSPAAGGPARASTNKPTPKQIDDQFSELQTKANKAYMDENFEEAKQLYTKALALKPNEDWPARQLVKIEERKAASLKTDEQKRLDIIFNRHKSIADSAYFKKAYDIARFEYEQALKIKSDRYVAAQIVKLNKISKEDGYKSYMKSGREAFGNKLYIEAEAAYSEALKLKPFDGEAKKELARTTAAKRAADKKATEQKPDNVKSAAYNDTIRTADNFFESGFYPEAKKSYKNADKLKPGEPYVSKRIKQIDSILLLQKAVAVQSKTSEANALMYARAVETGDKAFEAKDYKKAKTAYQQAISLNASEKYPGERMSMIDVILKQQEDQKLASLSLKEKAAREQKEYALYIKQGNAALAKKQYEEAKRFFMQAMQLKPFEKLPMAQLDIIHKKLDEIQNNRRYEHFVHLADSTAFSARNPASALQWYDSARLIKPAEAYPKKQIQAINADLLANASKALELQQQKERTLIFNQYFPEYKKGEDARLQGKYSDAYAAYSGFLSKLDTAHVDRYLSSQLQYIKQAKYYVNRLEAYKPKPVTEQPKPESGNEKKKRRGKKNA